MASTKLRKITASSTATCKEPRPTFWWTKAKILKLIERVKDSPQLWDPKHPDYSNKNKDEIWQHIAKDFKAATLKQVKFRFQALKLTYYKFNDSKRKPLDKSNMATWKYNDALKFLPLNKNIAAKKKSDVNLALKENIDESPRNEDGDFSIAQKKSLKKLPMKSKIHTINENSREIINMNSNSNEFWNADRIFKLIDCIKTSPILWDHCHPYRKDRFKKEKTFERIAKQFGGEANSTKIQTKFRALQIEFRANLRKKLRDKNCVISWKFFNALKFLANKPDADEEDEDFCNKDADNNDDDDDINIIWNEDRIFKLIDCIKSSPILWDHSHPDRKDRFKKEKTFERIAKQIGGGANSTKIKKKFRVLQIDFRANLRKKLRDKNCLISWKFFNALKFLANKPADNNNDDDKNILWNDDRIFKLIDCIKSSPILWDHSHPDRKDRRKRKRTFKLIAKQIGGEANSTKIQKKIRVLQIEFRANLRKQLRDKNCVISWKFFNALKFLASEPDADNEEFNQRSDTEMTKSYTNDASLLDTDNDDDDDDDINKFWNYNRILKLIDCVKTSPILWDQAHPDRRSIGKRERTFKLIAEQIGAGATSTKIRNKFRVLQNSFRINFNKRSRDKTSVITWQFFNALKFLGSKTNAEDDTDKDDHHDELLCGSDKTHKYVKKKSKAANDLLKDITDESVLNKFEFLSETESSPIWDYNSDSYNVLDEHDSNDVEMADTCIKLDVGETETYQILDYNNDVHNALEEHDSIDVEMNNSHTALDEHDSTDVNCEKLNDGENESNTKKDECITFCEYIASEMQKMKGHNLIESSFKSKVVRAILEANDAMRKGC